MSRLPDWMSHRLTVRACQLVIGLIFIVSGMAKLGDLGTFAKQIHNFRMVPVPTENLLAISLPWVELIAGLALVLGLRARAGAILTTAMMAVFTVAVLQALIRSLDIDCGCFGTADASRVGLVKLAQNCGMLGISVIAALRRR